MKLKKPLVLLLGLALTAGVLPVSAQGADLAYARTQTVLLDGEPVGLQAYALKDEQGYETNYVKLRDVAYLLNGTDARFQVSWDGAVNVVTGQSYTRDGSEMSTPFSGDRTYAAASAATVVNGNLVPLNAVTLTDENGGGYTYYKLRDLGEALGFRVDWSQETGVLIESNKSYSES